MSRVTVIVPNYNREALLPVCLESIRAQSFLDWHAVIGDNASIDRSVDVIRSFADPRFRLVRRTENVGYIRNTNLLIRDVDTEFVAILHSDDWWEPDFLRLMIELLDATPDASMAVCAVNYVVEGGAVSVKRLTGDGPAGSPVEALSPADATRALVRTWPFLTPSDVICRTDVYRRFAFEESLPLSTDWLMWLRTASAGPIVVCDRPLVNNRIHPSSVTGQAEQSALWADEWIRLARILEAEWSERSPFPGAAAELRAMNALRFVMKSYEMLERGNRTAALKLARLAEQTAQPRMQHAAALMLLVFAATAPPSFAVGLRRFMARLVRRLRRSRTPGRELHKPRSAVTDILAVLTESE